MKPLAWICALLPLFGIGLFYLFEPQQKAPPRVPIVAPKVEGVANSKLKPAPARSKENLERDIAQLRMMKEILEVQLKEGAEKLARTAKGFTPEVQQRMLDVTMRAREPSYRALFASWALDPATTEQALDIIREREKQQTTHRILFLKSGNSSEFKKERGRTDTTAQGQLVLLLGQDRFDQFVQLESLMQDETAAKAKRISQ